MTRYRFRRFFGLPLFLVLVTGAPQAIARQESKQLIKSVAVPEKYAPHDESPILDSSDLHPVNPFALADLVAGEPIDWAKEADPAKRLEAVFRMPRAQIFMPGGMLYNGAKQVLNAALTQLFRPPQTGNGSPKVTDPLSVMGITCDDWAALRGRDRRMFRAADRSDMSFAASSDSTSSDGRTIAEMADIDNGCSIDSEIGYLRSMNLDSEAWRNIQGPSRAAWLRLGFGVAGASPLTSSLCAVANALDDYCDHEPGWRADGVRWAPYGAPFSGAPLVTDPIQGVYGNCWFISGLASAAWVFPTVVRDRMTTPSRGRVALDLVRFDGSFDRPYPFSAEVSNELPLQSCTYLPIFARGTSVNASWPAFYEKAYASWNRREDRPDLSRFTENMFTGGVRFSFFGEVFGRTGTISLSSRPTWTEADALAFLGRYTRPDGRATAIMIAGTNGGPAAPGEIDREALFRAAQARFGDINIVPAHAYSVLGIIARPDGLWVVLRNPWGNMPAIGPMTLSGTWNGLTLGESGVFALRMEAFVAFFSVMSGVV